MEGTSPVVVLWPELIFKQRNSQHLPNIWKKKDETGGYEDCRVHVFIYIYIYVCIILFIKKKKRRYQGFCLKKLRMLRGRQRRTEQGDGTAWSEWGKIRWMNKEREESQFFFIDFLLYYFKEIKVIMAKRFSFSNGTRVLKWKGLTESFCRQPFLSLTKTFLNKCFVLITILYL